MKYTCVAVDTTGAKVEETVEAGSPDDAMETLRRRGWFVASVVAAGEERGVRQTRSRGGGRGRLKHLASVSRQLAVLVATGTPLAEALRAIESQATDGRWRAALGDVRRRVEEGASLAEAFAHHPALFDPVSRSLVAAGESGGNLDAMLNRLATLARQQQHVRSSLTGALMYPVLLIVVAGSVLALMFMFVLPRFSGLFETLHIPLPRSTEVLVVAGEFARAYWWAIGMITAGGAAGMVSWARTPRGRKQAHHLVLRMPVFGGLTRRLLTAQTLRLLGTLVDSRVPLLDALALTRESLTNTRYRRAVERAEEMVSRGEALSAGLAADRGLIESSVCEAVRSGERSGRLGPVLVSVAGHLEEENEVVLRTLTSLLEPAILIILGLLVGAVALSMFLPLFDLTAMTGTGEGA